MDKDDLPHFAAIIDSQSIDELKLTVLRAIDHARKSASEIDEYKARLDGALGQLEGLREENRILRSRIQGLDA